MLLPLLMQAGMFDGVLAPTPPPPPQEQFSGGFDYPLDLRRREEDEKAHTVIAAVAERQAAKPIADPQKHFEELERELTLRGLEWETRYLEALNQQRESLIRRRTAERMLLLLAAAI